jgi:hypothetical protein
MADEVEQNILDDVERMGWSLICVREDARGPSFVYSIGMMQTLNHPEIMMFGLDVDLMGSIINGMGFEIREGRRFDEEGLYEGLIEGFACGVAPVDAAHHTTYLGYAMWHRRHLGKIGTLRAVQCIWPDKLGLFPHEEGSHADAVGLQPRLQS